MCCTNVSSVMLATLRDRDNVVAGYILHRQRFETSRAFPPLLIKGLQYPRPRDFLLAFDLVSFTVVGLLQYERLAGVADVFHPDEYGLIPEMGE